MKKDALQRWLTSILAVAGVATVALGCSAATVSSPASSTPITGTSGGAEAVVRSLAAAGLDCTGLERRTPSTHVAEQAKCRAGDDDVLIRLFATTAERDAFLKASGDVVGQMSFDVDSPPRVIGSTWIVTTDTAATAQKIQAALGGELK